MKKLEWQVQVTRDGVQVPTFMLPSLLGLTTTNAACHVAMAILGGTTIEEKDKIYGTVMNHNYECFDIRTGNQLNK